MQLAFLLPSLSNNGPNVFTLNLIKGLLEIGVPFGSVKVGYFKEVRSNKLLFPVATEKISMVKVPNWLKDVDVVHSTMLRSDIFCFIHKKKFRGRLVSGIHNEIDVDLRFLYPPLIDKVLYFLWKGALKSFDSVVVSSDAMQRKYKEILAHVPIKKIPYGVPDRLDEKSALCTLNSFPKLPNGMFVIGACGLLIKRKGFDTLIRYLAVNQNSFVIIIGDGEERTYLTELARNLGVLDRLLITGFLENSFAYYHYFDLYALTSFSEGYGIAMLDALSLSLPVVISDLDIYREKLMSNDVAFFDPGEVKSFSNAVDRILSDIQQYKESSRSLYERNFGLKKMAINHMEYYKSL